MKKPTYFKEGKQYVCILEGPYDKIYMGFAACHPDDKDMENDKTGYYIAEARARMEILKATREECKIKLRALDQLYYSMNQSKNFNEKSYENKMLQRQRRHINFELAIASEGLVQEKENLKQYIENKERFYQKVRANRKAKQK